MIHIIGIGLLCMNESTYFGLGQAQVFEQPTCPLTFVKPVLPFGERLTTYNPKYVSLHGEYEPANIASPIPMEDRVPNYTEIQCVWASIETIGRWAEEPKLTQPALTSRPDCKSYSSPSLVAAILSKLEVKFEQTHGDRTAGIALIKKAMQEGRGCLFGVPGHAMVLVHYDEKTNIVKWIDNSDQTLKVQTMSVADFKKRWDTWALVIYADQDVLPNKILRIRVPIIDRNNPQESRPWDYIPRPKL